MALSPRGVVWLTMILHSFMGEDMPFLFISWMPYRLINHIPPLLLCLLVGIHGREERRDSYGPFAVIFATLFAAVYPFTSPMVGTGNCTSGISWEAK